MDLSSGENGWSSEDPDHKATRHTPNETQVLSPMRWPWVSAQFLHTSQQQTKDPNLNMLAKQKLYIKPY